MRDRNPHNSIHRVHNRTLLPGLSVLATALFIGGCLADDMDAPGHGGGSGGGGTGGGGGGSGSTDTYVIAGDVTGLGSDPVVLDLNGDETLTVNSDGNFSFQTELADGENYAVTVDTHPSEIYCDVSNDSGTVSGSDVDDIQVACEGLALSAAMSREAVELSWDRQDAVDIRYSTNPDCDWTNVSSCDNGGSVADVTGGQTTLTTDDGLQPDTAYSFVEAVDHAHSAPVTATPAKHFLSGPVNDTVVHDGKVYAGGEFRTFGPTAGGMASFRTDLNEVRQTGIIPSISHSSFTPAVYDIAEDPDGGWFIAGFFEEVEGEPRQVIARLNADGTLDTSWQANVGGNWILDILVHDGRLYIGGNFNSVDGDTSYSNLAALDLDGNLDTSFAPGEANGRVDRIIHANDQLYVAGGFTTLGGTTVDNIAALETSDGSVVSGFSVSTDDNVKAAQVDDGTLYIGGDFTQVNGTARESLAAVDLNDGSLAGQPDLSIDNDIWALELDDDSIFIGGEFTTVDGNTRERVAAIERSSGDLRSGWVVNSGGTVYDFSRVGDHLYIAGTNSEINGEFRYQVSRVNASTSDLDQDWVPVLDTNSPGYSWRLVEDGSRIHVLGHFNATGSEPLDNLAALELDSGNLVTDWKAGTDGPVHAVGADADTLYAGGNFDNVEADGNSYARGNASSFDLDNGQDRGWKPDANDLIRDLELNSAEDTVFLGGDFTTIKTSSRDRLAAVDTLKGDPKATGNAQVNGNVHSVHYLDSMNLVVFGGEFTSVNGNPNTRYHSVNESNFTTDNSLAGADDTVRAVWVDSTDTDKSFVGGDYTQLDSVAHNNFAWNPDGSGPDTSSPEADGSVHTIHHLDAENRLLVGGDFTQIDGSGRDRFALFDFDGSNITLQSSPSFNRRVRTVNQTSSHLIVGGDFTSVGGESQRHLVVLDAQSMDSAWSTNAMKSSSEKHDTAMGNMTPSNESDVNDSDLSHPGNLSNED